MPSVRSPWALLAALLWCTSANASQVPLVASAPHPDAPAQLRQWGQLVGTWDVEFDAPRPDGSWATGHAEWRWFYVLDGFAIQDVWINTPPPDTGRRALHGTNLRLFNPTKGKWDVAWIDNVDQKLQTFEAEYHDDGRLVMTQLGEGVFSRVTFYDMTPEHFAWRAEDSDDGGHTWKETFRIRGTRRH